MSESNGKGLRTIIIGAGRRQQAFVLVETDRPWRDSKLAGEFGNGIGLFLAHKMETGQHSTEAGQ